MADTVNVLVVGIMLGGIYAMVAVGLNLIFGVIRVVNFAQGEFVTLGLYGAYAVQLTIGMDPYLAVIVVVPLLFVLGAAIYFILLRPLQNEPMMQVFATFGILIVSQNAILALTGGIAYSVRSGVIGQSVAIGPVQIGLSRIIVLVAATLVTLALAAYLRHTRNGRAIRAVAQDRKAARLMGIRVETVYTVTFGIGAALAGLAGCLLSPLYTMSPQIGMNFILPAFAVVVLGGLGSVLGAFVGGFIVGLTEALAGYYLDPALKHAVIFIVFIAVLVVRPSGLFGIAGAEEVGLREQS